MAKIPVKKHLTNLVKFLFVAGILYYLFTSNLLDFSLLTPLLKDLSLVFLIFAIIFLVMVLGNLKWFILLKSQKINICFSDSFYLYYTGYTFNYFLPGGIAGDALKIAYITKRGQKRSVAALSIIIDRAIGLLAMILVIMFFLPSLSAKLNTLKWITNDYPHFVIPYFITISLLTVTTIVLVFYFINHKRTYQKITNSLKRKKGRIFELLLKLTKAIFSYRKSRMALLLNIIIAITIQIIIAISFLLAGQKILGENISLLSYTLASIITQIISVIPISPGGIGVGEVIFGKILYYLNNRLLLSYASVYFALRLLNILCSIPGILIFVFGQKKLLKK